MSDLIPCPYCGQSLEQPYLKNPEVYRHPENPDCFAGKAIVHPENYAAWNRRAKPAVQPDTAPAGNLTARGNAATWTLYDANLTRMGALQPDPLCECGMTGPCKWTECKAPILSAHVNETPKSEHDARDMLTPTTKRGDA